MPMDSHEKRRRESHSLVSDSLWRHGLYTVHGILQVRILEWVAFSFSKASSQPRDWTQISCVAGGFFTSWATNLVVFWKPNSWYTLRAFKGGNININKSIYQDHTFLRNPNCHLLRLKNSQDAMKNHSSWQLSRSQENIGMAKSYSKFQQFRFLFTPVSSRAAMCNHSQNSISFFFFFFFHHYQTFNDSSFVSLSGEYTYICTDICTQTHMCMYRHMDRL